MGLTLQPLRVRRAKEDQDPDELDEGSEKPRPSVNWSGGFQLRAQLSTLLLWLLLLCGPGAVVWFGVAEFVLPPRTSAVVASTNTYPVDQALAAEVGQRAVQVWLTTPRGKEDGMPIALPGFSGHVKPFRVAQLQVADLRPATTPGVWSVTVAAEVVDAKKKVSRQYFQVPVSVLPGGASVLALPAVVASPLMGQAPKSPYQHPIPVSSDLGMTVNQFLTALTTAGAAGDVNRYTAPGHEVRPVSPPPFTSVTVTELAATQEVETIDNPRDGREVELLVRADGQTASGQQLLLSYALSVRARSGRWEVTGLQATPAPSSNTSASPTPSTPPTATPTPTPTPTDPTPQKETPR